MYSTIRNILIVIGFLVPTNEPIKKISKHTSRIAAVQVMYQKDVADIDFEKTSANFLNNFINKEDDYKDINLSFYKRLLKHFPESDDFEETINKNIQNERSVVSSNVIIKSIIKVAMIEMIFEKTDMPIIINEFIEISRYFLDEKGVKFMNAVLDAISKQVERKCLIKAQ